MIKLAVLLICVSASLANPLKSANIDWRVVGGSTAAPGQFPFIVSLRTLFGSHTCGGSLIDNNWVITAAHCVSGSWPSYFSVVAGTNQLSASGVSSGVAEIIVHPEYNEEIVINDIALLRLSTPIQESSLIKIIPLETANDDTIRAVTLIGWGRTSYPGTIPDDLQYLPSKTVTYETCKNAWATETIVPSEICALTKAGQGACHGDSGGPLVSESSGDFRLVGLVSWGAPCALGSPDVYTRVSSFIDWIRQNTGLDL